MDIDHGFDALSCELKGVALDTKQAKPAESTPGQATDYRLQLVDSSDELRKSIGLSAQASVNMGVYGGDAKADFAASRSVNSSSVFLVAKVVVRDKTAQYNADALRQIDLDSHVRDLYANNPYEFRQDYGNCFIAGREFGGEMYCVLEIITHSSEDKMSLSAEAEGHGESFKASGKFTGAIDALTKNRQVKLWVYKKGGSPLTVDPDKIGVNDFIRMTGIFAGELKDNPQPYGAILTPYNQLASLTGLQGRSALDRQNVETVIAELTQSYLKYQDAVGDLNYMTQNQDEFVFPPVDKKKVEAAKTKIKKQQTEIRAALREVAQPPDPSTIETYLKTVDSYDQREWPSVDELTADLPQRLRHLPRSAKDLKRQYPDLKEDGEYDIYLDGKMESRVTLYCKDMATANPREYISLQQTGGDKNRSYWPASTSRGQCWRSGKDLTTSYSRIRFDPMSRTVDLDDATFAKTSGGPLTDRSADGKVRWTRNYAPYAAASASNHIPHADRQPRTPYGTANVDLRGTGFRIDDDVTWKTSGFDVKARSSTQVPDKERGFQVIDVEVGGATGDVRPSPELRLALVPSKRG